MSKVFKGLCVAGDGALQSDPGEAEASKNSVRVQNELRTVRGQSVLNREIHEIRWSNLYNFLPVVPHKAVAEVSKIGNL